LVARLCGFGVEACGPRGAVEDAAPEVFRRQGEHLSVLVEGAAPGDHLAELRGCARPSGYSPRPASALSKRPIFRAALLGWMIPFVAARAKALCDSSRKVLAVSSSPESMAL
jgi:hypothetical protein